MEPTYSYGFEGIVRKHIYLAFRVRATMSIETHPQTLLVRNAVFACVKAEERGQVCVGKPVCRQSEGRVVVENFDTLCVSSLLRALPSRCRVFSRAPPTGSTRVTLTRLEIYYPLESAVWRWRNVILTFVWVILPVAVTLVWGYGVQTAPSRG